VNLLPLEEGEKINAILPVKEFSDDQFIFFATSQGTVKKTPLSDFANPRKAGIIAITIIRRIAQTVRRSMDSGHWVRGRGHTRPDGMDDTGRGGAPPARYP